MGQFHSDFESDILKGGKKDIHAVESIFLGKKCYIDKRWWKAPKIDSPAKEATATTEVAEAPAAATAVPAPAPCGSSIKPSRLHRSQQRS